MRCGLRVQGGSPDRDIFGFSQNAEHKKKHPAQAVQSCHELLLWIIPHLDKFPRNRRFTLGERLEKSLLNVLADLTEAAYSKQKHAPLAHANRELAICRHLWRLAFELQAVSCKSYEHGAKLIDGIGNQIGAWLKGDAKPDKEINHESSATTHHT